MRLLFAGGGSAGHVTPGLAVVAALRRLRPDVVVLWLGSHAAMEGRLVADAGIELALVHAGKLNRFVALQTLRDLAKAPIGCVEALAVTRHFRPSAVCTIGGYVAVPAGLAAGLLRLPLLVHQQDTTPNLANRLIAPFATTVNVSFAPSLHAFPGRHVEQNGNPVRAALFAGDAARASARFGLEPDRPLLLVTGGSQGAAGINRLLFAALPRLLDTLTIVHACGEQHLAAAMAAKAALPAELARHFVVSGYFADELPDLLAAASLVVCRAGAGTLSELAVLGKPSLLLPLPPTFGRSPQETNARYAVAQGAALMADERALTVDAFARTILNALAQPALLSRLSENIGRLGSTDAAERVALRLIEIAGC